VSQAVREAEAARVLCESLRATVGDDEAAMLDLVEGETGLFEAIDRLLQHMVDTQALVRGVEAAEADLGARKRRFEERIERYRSLIEQALSIAEITSKVERPLATFSLVRRAPKVEITDEAQVPSAYWKAADPKLDKKALADALKAGATIPGAVLSNAAPSVTIRFA
jgi:hypothetical protein